MVGRNHESELSVCLSLQAHEQLQRRARAAGTDIGELHRDYWNLLYLTGRFKRRRQRSGSPHVTPGWTDSRNILADIRLAIKSTIAETRFMTGEMNERFA